MLSYYHLTKRALDICFSFIGLGIASPLMLIITILIRLESPGPVLFSQARLGVGGKKFLLYKFRKFPGDWGTRGPGVTVAGDARMTVIGKYLERTKLDELPQLWNILRGEMSFVGPRPESLQYADLFSGRFKAVLDFVPGIFGPNQVEFRNESAMYPADEDPEVFYRRYLFPKKAESDLQYFSHANNFHDILWIIRGLWVSVAGVVDWHWVINKIIPVLMLDFVAIELAWTASLLTRFGTLMPHGSALLYWKGLWLLPAIILPIMLLGGYRHTLRHIVLSDVLRMASLLAAGWFIGFVTLLWLETRNTSLALGPLGVLFLVTFAIIPRISIKEYLRRHDLFSRDRSGAQKIIIFGTDDRAVNLGSLLQRGFSCARLVGFLDNSPEMVGRTILNAKVVGSERDLSTLLSVHHFDQLWLSFSPDNIQRERLENWAEKNHINLVILPEIKEFEALFPYSPATHEMQPSRDTESIPDLS